MKNIEEFWVKGHWQELNNYPFEKPGFLERKFWNCHFEI